MSQLRRVLVTGCIGNLGAKAVQALKTVPNVAVGGIDRRVLDSKAQDFISADLEHYDESWTQAFRGVACVIHLAADPKPVSNWDSIVRLNIDLSLNVLRAAEEAGVERVVFASSNWVFGGYRFTDHPLQSGLTPRPVNPYGASKLFIERCGLALTERTGMAFLALRIGYCQPGENRPGPHMAFGRWGQQMWLGNCDWAQAVVKATTAPFVGFAAVNIVSRNAGMRWDLEEARAAIGYVPDETHQPRQNSVSWMKDQAARRRDRLIPKAAGMPLFGARW